MQGVYEIHLFQPIGTPQTDEQRAEWGLPPRKPGARFQAEHYIGYAEDIDLRLEAHRKGNGSKFMVHVARAGIRWELVRVWLGMGREWERHLKNQKHAARLCPICNPNALACCKGSERGKE